MRSRSRPAGHRRSPARDKRLQSLFDDDHDHDDHGESKPDVVQRFVDASIEGWYNYLYGDNKAANDLIKKDNPEMTDGQIEYSIAKMKEYGIVNPRKRWTRASAA